MTIVCMVQAGNETEKRRKKPQGNEEAPQIKPRVEPRKVYGKNKD